MSLTERFFPVMRHDFNFFDAQAAYMEREFRQRENQVETLQQHMDRQMAAMRSCMFQLIPSDPNDVAISEIETNRPIVEEKGETKLKLEFNVQGFKPEEIKVKVLGNNILQVINYRIFMNLLREVLGWCRHLSPKLDFSHDNAT